MDYRENEQEAAFRQKVRTWLADNAPKGWQSDAVDEATAGRITRDWHKKLYEAGLIGLSWPLEYGGQNLGPTYEAILNDEMGKADTPRISFHNYLGRAIFGFGTEEQKQRFLPSMLSGEVQWCQGFSEPDAGSDLASLRTFAELKGDTYVVNGQKMWTSGALNADWCLLLVRTDRDVPKHKGITCLLTPLKAPGIDVRPIRISDGAPETCEVFLDDVKIPASHRVGDPGAGWRIAMTVLSFERGPADIGMIATYDTALRKMSAMAAERGLINDPEIRKALARAYVHGEALRLVVVEQLSQRNTGRMPGPEGSVARLLLTEAQQYIAHLELEIMGADAFNGQADTAFNSYIRSRTISIFGGTSQIQKNILANQVLGMPR